jgi:hypothetical protein
MTMYCDEDMASVASTEEMSTPDAHVSNSSFAVFLDTLINERVSEETGPLRIPQLQRFDSSKLPPISLYDYTERLVKYAHFDKSPVLALIYMERLLAADSNFAISFRNVHRLLITCMTVAEKYLNDQPYVNSYYASVGGLRLEELNRLEAILARALAWRLGASQQDYNKKLEEVRLAFVGTLSASLATEWILVQDESVETHSGAACEKKGWDSPSDSSLQASTISGSASTISGGGSVSDTDLDSSSEADDDSVVAE